MGAGGSTQRPVLAVQADDLTGAADTLLMFAQAGLTSAVYLERPAAVDVAVPAVVTETRAGPAERAAGAAADAMAWLAGLAPAGVFKKVDSYLRGFPGAEVAACRPLLPGHLVAVAPAFPALGRRTIGGLQLHDLRPLEVTEAGRDPVAPASTSSVPDLFGSLHVDLRTVARGPAAVAAAVAGAMAAGRDVLSFDAATEADLDAVVAGVGDRPALWVGSAGLAGRLALRLAGSTPTAPPPARRAGGPVLLVVGTVSRVTAAQVQSLAGALGPALTHLGVDPAGAAAAGGLAARDLAGGRCVLLTPATAPAGQPDPASARVMAEALAEAAAAALAGCPDVGGLVLTGGDTALATCRRLGARALALVGAAAPVTPLSLIRGGPCAGLPVVTKGGAVGAEDNLLACVQALGAC